MKGSLYVIHDRVTEQFGEIFEAFNDSSVRRVFTEIFKSQYKSGIPVKDVVIICVATCDKSGSVPVVTPVPVPYTVLRGDEIVYDEAPEKPCAACSCTCSTEVVHDSLPET